VRHLLLCATLALAAPGALAAQPGQPPPALVVAGRVLDVTSGEPVANAVVRLPDVGVFGLSDADGYFLLRGVPAGTHPWEISRLGYASWREELEAAGDEVYTVRLLPRAEVLQGLLVVADRLQDRRLSSGMSARVFERGEVIRAGGGDLPAFLQSRLGTPLVSCGTDPELNCTWVRGRLMEIRVFLDEQLALGGISQLHGLDPAEVQSIEVFAGGAMLRVYTVGFMERAASGRVMLLPLPYYGGVPELHPAG
jgi:iron complex outermembrane receptor protein